MKAVIYTKRKIKTNGDIAKDYTSVLSIVTPIYDLSSSEKEYLKTIKSLSELEKYKNTHLNKLIDTGYIRIRLKYPIFKKTKIYNFEKRMKYLESFGSTQLINKDILGYTEDVVIQDVKLSKDIEEIIIRWMRRLLSNCYKNEDSSNTNINLGWTNQLYLQLNLFLEQYEGNIV